MSREELEKRLKDVKDRIKMIDVELEDEEYPVEPEERESLIREKNELERQQKELEEQISNMQENEENTNEEPIAEFEASGRIDFRNNYLNALQQANIDPSDVYDPMGIFGKKDDNKDAQYELTYTYGGADGLSSDDNPITTYRIIKRKTREEPEPIQEPDPKKEPLMFGEILSNINAAENALSFGQVDRYNISQTSFNPYSMMVVDERDWVHNAVRAIKITFDFLKTLPTRLFCKMFTSKATKRKMEVLRENIDALPPEEFETLYKGLQSYKGIENAVSPSVRQCVLERATRETQERNDVRNKIIEVGLQVIIAQHKESMQIAQQLKDPNLTEKEKVDLIAKKKLYDTQNVNILREIEKAREEGSLEQVGGGLDGLKMENKATREGSNIQGRKFGKRFTKNVELEKEQAKIEARIRTAREEGNNFDEVQAYIDHQMLMEGNTKSKTTLGIKHNTGDRNRCEGVRFHSRMKDDLVENIISIGRDVAVAVALHHVIKNAIIVGQYNQTVLNNNAKNAAEAARTNSSIRHQNQQARIINQQISNVQNNIPGARAAVKATEDQTGNLETFASLTGAHDVGGATYKWNKPAWRSGPEDIALHTAERNGIAPNIDTTMQDAANTFKGWNPTYDRGMTVRTAEQFLNNGGKAVLGYGPAASNGIFTQIENLMPYTQNLMGVTFTPQGQIAIYPEFLASAVLGAQAVADANKALTRNAANMRKKTKKNKWRINSSNSKGRQGSPSREEDNENRQNGEEDMER